LTQSVQDRTANSGFRVLGNPATATLRGSSLEPGSVELYDAMGRRLMQQVIAAGTWELDVRSLPRGIVYLHFASASGRKLHLPVLLQAW
jgi:hypothetical protein